MSVVAAADSRRMLQACEEAERGLGHTSPNPAVGCVVVKKGRLVGRGFHAAAGQAHAEVKALSDAGAAARGATVYVTLEPCCVQGRTPACTDALIAAGEWLTPLAKMAPEAGCPNPTICCITVVVRATL